MSAYRRKCSGAAYRNTIIFEVKERKYFSIIVDSTPDISHIDQLSFVLRYVKSDGVPVERFLQFIPNPGYKAEALATTVLTTLDSFEMNIADCRGQSYDNARNMSGPYSGLQARIKEHNKLADYVPCATHSLNLVGSCAVESCSEAALFFTTVQTLYNFFSSSTNRWEIFQTRTQGNTTLKSLSTTRWSARADAVTALHNNFSEIIKILEIIEKDETENSITRQEAKGILKQLERLETAFMQILWHFLLSRLNAVSQKLQDVNISLVEVIDLYKGLIKIVTDCRTEFDHYEQLALEVSDIQEYQSVLRRKRRRTLCSDETRDGEVEFTGRDNFRINVFNVILDNLRNEFLKRMSAYKTINNRFGVITDFKNLSDNSEIREKSETLRKFYFSDLEPSLGDEFIHFHAHCVSQGLQKKSPLDLLKFLRKNDLYSVFPNVEIAYRMFICTAVTNCSAERSFSCLKRIKTYLRSTMSEDRLNSLAIMNIEVDILSKLDCEQIITDFATKKVRRKCF